MRVRCFVHYSRRHSLERARHRERSAKLSLRRCAMLHCVVVALSAAFAARFVVHRQLLARWPVWFRMWPRLPGGFTRGDVWATEDVVFMDGSMVQKHTKGYILGASTTSPAKWLQVSWEHRGDGRTGKLITSSWPYHLTPREPPLPWVRVSDAVTLPIQCLIEAVLTAEPCALSCLGLQPHLTHPKKTIRARFRVLAIRLHPDKESHPRASEAFLKVRAAHDQLTATE